MTRGEALRLLAIPKPEPSPEEVRAAFRREAKRVHPDVQQGEIEKRRGEERLKLLAEARSLLLNPPPEQDAAPSDTQPRTPASVPPSGPFLTGEELQRAARRAWQVIWRARYEPVVQVLGWVVLAWALVARIYPWWTVLLPVVGAGVLASVLPARTEPASWPSWARRGRAAAAEVGGLLAFAVVASAVAAGVVALVG